jgi:hypothetical protein
VQLFFINDFFRFVFEGVSLLHLVLLFSVPHFALFFFPVDGCLHAVNLCLRDVQLTSNILNDIFAALGCLTRFENSLFTDLTFFGHFEFGEG